MLNRENVGAVGQLSEKVDESENNKDESKIGNESQSQPVLHVKSESAP